MAQFVVRVQLTKEVTADYTRVRDGLLKIGFTKRITDSSGVEWRLPNGNYLIITESEREAVIDAVKGVVFQVDRNPMILVTKVAPKGAIWFGLERC